MRIQDCFKIGYVVKPHGLKGEINISLDNANPIDFAGINAVFVAEGENLVPYFITASSVTGNKAFVKFEDVDHLDDASGLAGKSLYLPKAARPTSEQGDFYDDEIIGFTVEDESLGQLGAITDVMTAGSNRLLVMEYREKEVLIPINSPFITNVNKDKKHLTVLLPEGFLEI